jgi:hypothetical protein
MPVDTRCRRQFVPKHHPQATAHRDANRRAPNTVSVRPRPDHDPTQIHFQLPRREVERARDPSLEASRPRTCHLRAWCCPGRRIGPRAPSQASRGGQPAGGTNKPQKGRYGGSCSLSPFPPQDTSTGSLAGRSRVEIVVDPVH